MNLFGELSETANQRILVWNALFEKYSKAPSEDEPSYCIEDIPLQEVPTPENYDELQPLSKRKVTKLIEGVLKSDIKALLFKREKAKILMDHKSYPMIHYEVKMELKRLLKHITLDDFEVYVAECVKPCREKAFLIEQVFNSKLKNLLLYPQCTIYSKNFDFGSYIAKLKHEWDSLVQALGEEDVIVYSIQVIRESLYK